MNRALSIAGFDPSSGAGITADLQTFAAHGLFGLCCMTAQTVQSTRGVRAVQPVAPAWVGETLACLQEDLPVAGVKIGMLATAGVVRAVHNFLLHLSPSVPIVLDPVLVSTSGRELLEPEAVPLLRDLLLFRVTWATPNAAELGILTGLPVATREQVSAAAHSLSRAVPGLSLVVTGGDGDRPDDLVLLADGTATWLSGVHVASRATHGTGCAFSSALLANLIAGMPGIPAARAAKDFVAQAIRSAEPQGSGFGPMNLLWPLRRQNPAAD